MVENYFQQIVKMTNDLKKLAVGVTLLEKKALIYWLKCRFPRTLSAVTSEFAERQSPF